MILYAATIFLSAFLLFQVQPMIAKMILPWFGGSAAVWTICMLFFQILLLLGYLYAWASTKFLKPSHQAWLHSLLLLAAIPLLPIVPDQSWKPLPGTNPATSILLLLLVTTGLPYFLLSATSPLLQAWYAASYRKGFPYRFYALSNVGSLLALLSYPVAVEPYLQTRTQATIWSSAFAIFGLLCVTTAFWRLDKVVQPADTIAPGPKPSGIDMFLWVAISAAPSVLFLAVTNHLTQDVASVPFLWIIPLTLYLLSFILCFERDGRWYRRWLFLPLLPLALFWMAHALQEYSAEALKSTFFIFLSSLFICCMVCHGELSRMKPAPRYLTSFYLLSSLGGASGGMFVGLIAPALFSSYNELPLGIVLCGAVVVAALWRPGDSGHLVLTRPVQVASLAGIIALSGYLTFKEGASRGGEAKFTERNFYGKLEVLETDETEEPRRMLINGSINHGSQFLSSEKRGQPTTYYGPLSGIGLALLQTRGEHPQRVGVIGLGTGTIACYGRRGDSYRFYEINPLVIKVAATEFSYLQESPAKVEVVTGDARLSMEREPKQAFDVLAVDAFSGDSIPVHLLTMEAFMLYLTHLRPEGILAVHISNKYLDLQPIVAAIAARLHLSSVLIDSDGDDDGVFGAMWVLLSRNDDVLDKAAPELGSDLVDADASYLWTDDYSNLYKILR